MCATDRHEVRSGALWVGHGFGAFDADRPGARCRPCGLGAWAVDLVTGSCTEPADSAGPALAGAGGVATAPDRRTPATTSTPVRLAVAARRNVVSGGDVAVTRVLAART